MKISKSIGVMVAISLGFVTLGCSAGMAPKVSDDQAQADFNSEPPEKQIEGIQHSPLPPDRKEAEIKKIEQKYGVKRGADTAAPGPGGAPSR